MKIGLSWVLSALVVVGQDGASQAPLRSGDQMLLDGLESAEWIQGEAPLEWKEDTVYVIGCWATWCAPSLTLMPYYNKLQLAHATAGLQVIGMNVWETRAKGGEEQDPEAADEAAVKRATRVVQEQGEGMSFPVAVAAKGGAFENSWLKAAGVEGIPYAFVVKNGSYLFGTHPGRLDDDMMSALLAGGDEQKKVVESLRVAERKHEDTAAVMREFRLAHRAEDAKRMAEALEKLERANPDAPFLTQMRLDLAMTRKDWDGVVVVIRRLGSGAGAGRVLSSLAFRFDRLGEAIPIEVRKSLASEFAKALEGDKGKPTDYLILARLRWTLGDKEQAIADARTAVGRVETLPAGPFEGFLKALEEGNPPPIADVYAELREAMQAQADEQALKVAEEMKKAAEAVIDGESSPDQHE